MEAFFFVVVAYTKSEVTATMALCLGVAFSGFAISGEEGSVVSEIGQDVYIINKSIHI